MESKAVVWWLSKNEIQSLSKLDQQKFPATIHPELLSGLLSRLYNADPTPIAVCDGTLVLEEDQELASKFIKRMHNNGDILEPMNSLIAVVIPKCVALGISPLYGFVTDFDLKTIPPQLQ